MKKLVFVIICLFTISACSSDTQNSITITGGDVSVSTGESQVAADFWPQLQAPIPADPALEQKISALMAQMRLEDKIGQMIQGEIRSVTPEDVKKYRLGSVLNGGGTRPNNDKYATPQDWLALADAYYQASMDTRAGGLAIPIIWGTDAVHGHNNVIGATLFPHNIGLGAANDPELVKRIARATAKEVAVTGIDWIFAPTVAVVQDDRWGRTYESYSENPALVATYAEKIVEGLQGAVSSTEFLDETHAIATAKHFIGDGGTEDGIDQGNNTATEEQLKDIHAAGYLRAIPAGVQTVMASYNSWHGKKLHGHRYLLTDVLKTRLGFDGFVVGDWNGHGQIEGCDNIQCAPAINAGLDMFMVPQDWKALYENTLAQAKRGDISMERIDDAVRRILRVKFRAGLFEKGAPSNRPYAGKTEFIGYSEHRELAREAVRKSLVLLKNDNQTLPLSPDITVAVVGDAADNIGKQTGGWTISWQGDGNTNEDFPGASTILNGIEDLVSAGGGKVIYNPNGSDIEMADVAIAIYGENPYAEMHGDVTTYEYQPGNKIDLAILEKFKAKGIPVVSVFISGRPLWVNPELNRSDAFLAAWLPGSEGKAVADVLFKQADGSIHYDFTGKLSFSWPKTPTQQLNYHGSQSDGENYNPLFPFGYGLSYSDHTNNIGNQLSESGMAPTPALANEVILYNGEPQVPWQLYLQESGDNSIKIRAPQQSGLFNTIAVERATDKSEHRSVQWTGEREAEVFLAVNSAIDFSSYHNGILEFATRLDSPLTSKITLAMTCGESCSGEIDISNHLINLSANSWNKFSIALACFSQQGMNLSNVLKGFSLTSDGAANVSFGDVSLKKAGADSASVRCQQ